MRSPCEYYNSDYCRSCSLINLPYSEQLRHKTAHVEQLLHPLLGQQGAIAPTVAADSPLGSRAKMKLAIGGTQHSPVAGMVSSQGEVRDLRSCPLHYPILNTIANETLKLLPGYTIEPYSIHHRTGELKYLLAQLAPASGEVAVRFVLRSLACREEICALALELQRQVPAIAVTSINLQPEPKAIIEGQEEIVISKRSTISDQVGPYWLEYSPQGFSQVTPNIAEKLYHHAARTIHDCDVKYLLDLYCGAGAFSIFAAASVTKSIGVELSRSSVAVAKQSARKNNVTNVEFICADVAAYLQTAPAHGDGVLVNPPRAGLASSVLAELRQRKPTYLFYSSCNPETLARDLNELCIDYQVTSVMPFDMFPMTNHLEVFVALQHR